MPAMSGTAATTSSNVWPLYPTRSEITDQPRGGARSSPKTDQITLSPASWRRHASSNMPSGSDAGGNGRTWAGDQACSPRAGKRNGVECFSSGFSLIVKARSIGPQNKSGLPSSAGPFERSRLSIIHGVN